MLKKLERSESTEYCDEGRWRTFEMDDGLRREERWFRRVVSQRILLAQVEEHTLAWDAGVIEAIWDSDRSRRVRVRHRSRRGLRRLGCARSQTTRSVRRTSCEKPGLDVKPEP